MDDAFDMPEFRDPQGGVYVWDAESKSYVWKSSADLEQDRGHSTGGDNDLFNQNQIEHSELAGVPELEGYMARTAAQGEYAPQGRVKCPMCSEITDLPVCPQCHKDLTPEWNNEGGNNEFFGTPGTHSDASEFLSWPERVPKRNREKTDDSYPSMNLSSYEAAVKLSRVEKLSQDEWDAIFAGDAPMKTEIGKWLIDLQGRLHYEHGMQANHEPLALRDGLDYPADVGALGSVYNDGTADVQRVFPQFKFDHEDAQNQIEQAFGPVTLAAQVGQNPEAKKGISFEPFEINGGQWIIDRKHSPFVTGIAWVKERSEGQSYQANMILVAEHLQPEDFALWAKGAECIVTATGGLTSHAAHLAITQGIPTIVGIGEAYNKLETGDYLKIDPLTKTITVMPGATHAYTREEKQQVYDAILQHQQTREVALTSKPQSFSHYDEELAWREANTPSLEKCPECGDPMTDQDGESVCHSCGHKQPIIHTAAPLAALGELVGGEAAGAAGGEGLGGIGGIMNKALGPGFGKGMLAEKAFGDHGGDTTVNVGDGSDQIDTGSGSAGVISRYTTSGVLSILEGLFDILKKTPEAFVDPKNPLSYADDLAGVAAGTNQLAQQGTPAPTTAKTADTFGEDEDGWATKNRGDNSDPDQQSSSGADTKERGDAPEQLKDVDGIGGPKDPSAEGESRQGDPALQDKALKAFHLNMPLVIEFANSDEAGAENPILVALDQLLEEAFPGYKDGTGDGEDEHPVEEINVEIPSNDGEPKEESEDSDESDFEKKRNDTKEASVWHFAMPLGDYEHWNEEAPRVWWEEEGRHQGEPDEGYNDQYERDYSAEDAFAEELAERSPEELQEMLADRSYLQRYPKAEKLIQAELEMRGTGEPEVDPVSVQTRDLEGHGGGRGFYSGTYPMQPGAFGAPAPAATGVAGIPTCPMCGQSHVPGTPCPTAAAPVTAPTAQGMPMTPPVPNKVVTKWQVVSVNPEDLGETARCLDGHKGDCAGNVEMRPSLSGTGTPIPRCDKHWNERLDEQQRINEKYPSQQPSDFDPDYAGEQWDEDPGVYGSYEEAPAAAIRHGLDEPTQWGEEEPQENPECPMCAGPGVPLGTLGRRQHFRCRNCGMDFSHENEAEAPVSSEMIPGWPEGRPANAKAIEDPEFAFFTAAEEGEHHHQHEVEHRQESDSDDDSPWTDEAGAALHTGAQYELKSDQYAIPDRITIDRVLPDKLIYTTDSGEVKYRNEITAQDVATNGYSFAPVDRDDAPMDSADGFQDYEAPTRPGQDATPQVDDLSTPQTVVSQVASLDDYTGSFKGDSPDDRSWLMGNNSSEVAVDPGLMAKFAGRDYSPREQREFIDEKGEARNLDRLDLDGTHYIMDEYEDSLW